MQKLILRADGNSKIGYGHIFRVLALGEWYADKYDCILLTAAPDELIKKAANNSGVGIMSLAGKIYALPDENIAGQEVAFDLDEILTGSETVITDGYLFGTRYQQQIKNKGCKLVCVDDEAKWHFVSDAIINPAPSISTAAYDKEDVTRIFSGKDYFILRKCFLSPVPQHKENKAVYISVGGADYYGFSRKIAETILADTVFTVHVLCSSAFAADTMAALNALEIQYMDRVKLHCNLSGPEVVSVIDQCTHAIVSSSTVSLEVVARGIKPLIGHFVQNQLGIYNGMLKEEMATGLGSFHDLDTDIIQTYLVQNAVSTIQVGGSIDKILSDING